LSRFSRITKYVRSPTQEDLDEREKKLTAKLKAAEKAKNARLRKMASKNKITELKGKIKSAKREGRKKIRIFGREYYV
jgi:F0F1-type ATP synthase membrane subunit b/b'